MVHRDAALCRSRTGTRANRDCRRRGHPGRARCGAPASASDPRSHRPFARWAHPARLPLHRSRYRAPGRAWRTAPSRAVRDRCPGCRRHVRGRCFSDVALSPLSGNGSRHHRRGRARACGASRPPGPSCGTTSPMLAARPPPAARRSSSSARMRISGAGSRHKRLPPRRCAACDARSARGGPRQRLARCSPRPACLNPNRSNFPIFVPFPDSVLA